MKEINPWVIVRWALVVVIYAATLAIAIDQVRIRDRKIAGLETLKKDVQKGLGVIASQVDGLKDNNIDTTASLDKLKLDLVQQEADQAKAAKLAELIVLTAQRLQKQAEGNLLTDKLQSNIATGNALKAEGNRMLARGSITISEVIEMKSKSEKLENTHLELMPKYEAWKRDILAIDARRKVLKEECGLND